ncbi:MAG: hypothetical protein ACKVOP_05945 [Sphingomonadaceae bacterium]
MRITVAAFAAVCLFAPAHARPVTFPGGSMSMTEIDDTSILTQIDHTLSRKIAIGVYGLSENSGERLSTGAVVNYLAFRKNTPDSQANGYVMAGFGPSWSRLPNGRRSEAEASGWVALEADWETRRLFVGGMAKLSVVGRSAEAGWRVRTGFAPYVANSGKLHTWAFVQVGRAAEPGAKTEITPLVRLFKGPILVEAGASLTGKGFGTLWLYF